jgi:hypothetical protein
MGYRFAARDGCSSTTPARFHPRLASAFCPRWHLCFRQGPRSNGLPGSARRSVPSPLPSRHGLLSMLGCFGRGGVARSWNFTRPELDRELVVVGTPEGDSAWVRYRVSNALGKDAAESGGCPLTDGVEGVFGLGVTR